MRQHSRLFETVSSFVAAAILASTLWLATPDLVSAAGACAGGTSNYFAGWWSTPTLTGHEPEGVKSNLMYRDGDGCSAAVGGRKGRGAWLVPLNPGTSEFLSIVSPKN